MFYLIETDGFFFLRNSDEKILNLGMCKDHLITPEEKLSKQQHLEANRRIRSTQINPENTLQTTTMNREYESGRNKTDYSNYTFCFLVENSY